MYLTNDDDPENKNAKIVFIITRSTEDRWEQTDSFIQFLTEKQL